MIYLKFWKQACIPISLFEAEIWCLTSTQHREIRRIPEVVMFHLQDYVSDETLTL